MEAYKPHSTHIVLDVSDITMRYDLLCKQCDKHDEELNEPCLAASMKAGDMVQLTTERGGYLAGTKLEILSIADDKPVAIVEKTSDRYSFTIPLAYLHPAKTESVVIKTTNMEKLVKFLSEEFSIEFLQEKHGKGPIHYASQNQNGALLEIYPSIKKESVTFKEE